MEFPALYTSADKASARAQTTFWWMIRLEYFLLFLVASLGVSQQVLQFGAKVWMTVILGVLACLFVFKVYKKFDQDWYRCRALAESIKTSTWRFAMRAHPFQDAGNIEEPRRNFRNLLREILKANQNLAQNLQDVDSAQVTQSMLQIRDLSLNDRLAFYVSNRIDDQRKWYSRKSNENRKTLHKWIGLTVLLYLGSLLALHAEAIWAPATVIFDPIIVIVTSAIGWIQMKRFGELTASYNLTAHEIGIIRSNSEDIKTEEDFSEFVNEAELAFSREHTQWVARRDAT